MRLSFANRVSIADLALAYGQGNYDGFVNGLRRVPNRGELIRDLRTAGNPFPDNPNRESAFVLELAPSVGVTIDERALHDADLFDADEAFVTSSTQEIVPIASVDGKGVGAGRPGPITKTLHAEYRRRVAGMCAPEAAR